MTVIKLTHRLTIIAALVATSVMAQPAAAQLVTRHQNSEPGLILKGVTVKPGATMLYLSGQLASPVDPSNKKPMAELTMADFGDTKTQTISALNKIRQALAEQGFAMSDVIKLTVFLVGDPKLGGKMDFAGMNAGFKQFFGSADNPVTVARSTVQVAALAAAPFLVEIEATAAK